MLGGGIRVVASGRCAAGSGRVSGRCRIGIRMVVSRRVQGGSDRGLGYVRGRYPVGIRQVLGRLQADVEWGSGGF